MAHGFGSGHAMAGRRHDHRHARWRGDLRSSVHGRLFFAFGVTKHFDQGVTLRFPIYLNLITAVVTLWIALACENPGREYSTPFRRTRTP